MQRELLQENIQCISAADAKFLGSDFFFVEQAWATRADGEGRIIWTFPYGHKENLNAVIGPDGFFCDDNGVLRKVLFSGVEAYSNQLYDTAAKFLSPTEDGGLIFTESQRLFKINQLGTRTEIYLRSVEAVRSAIQTQDESVFYLSSSNDSLYLIKALADSMVFRKLLDITVETSVALLEGADNSIVIGRSTAPATVLVEKLDMSGNSVFSSFFEFIGPFKRKIILRESSAGDIFLLTDDHLETSNKSYIVSSKQVVVTKMSGSGNMIWQKNFGGPTQDVPLNIQ